MGRTNLAQKNQATKQREFYFCPCKGGSGGMLPQKILKIESLRLAKNALSALKIQK